MQDYDVYLFDWDGTIANSTAVWVKACREQFEKIGLFPTDDQIVRALGDWKNMQHLGLTADHHSAFITAVTAQVEAELPNAPFFDGVHDVLLSLKQNQKKIAVVTAAPGQVIDMLLRHHDLLDFFDAAVVGTEVQHLKPHPEALHLALERLQRKPSERVLMLGDTGRDILAAHEAGVDSLLYYPPEHHALHDLEELRAHRPTHIIHDWKHML